jgi:hypothetical protein
MLTLRRPDESDEAVGEEATPLSEILSGRSKVASDGPTNASTQTHTTGFTQLLEQATAQPQPAATVATAPAWTLEVISPSERKRYEWSDLKSLPTETIVGAAGTGGTPATPVSTSSGSTGDSTNSPSGDGDKTSTDKTSTDKTSTDKTSTDKPSGEKD